MTGPVRWSCAGHGREFNQKRLKRSSELFWARFVRRLPCSQPLRLTEDPFIGWPGKGSRLSVKREKWKFMESTWKGSIYPWSVSKFPVQKGRTSAHWEEISGGRSDAEHTSSG